MGVYRHSVSGIWHYEFRYQGHRFYGSTGQRTRRKAEAVEEARRLEAATGIRQEDKRVLTLDEAAGRYWIEHAQHLKSAAKVEARLAVLLECITPTRKITAIRTATIKDAIAKRRGMLHHGKPPSNSTINRDIIDTTMRPLHNHARLVWELPGLPAIAWKKLRLKEPKPRVREFSAAEMDAWRAELPEHWRFFFHLVGLYGMRLAEMFFPLSAIDLNGPRIVLPDRKNDELHTVPLLDEDAREIAARMGRAVAAGIDTIWFRELKGGRLKPLQYWSAQSAMRKARDRAKITNARPVHDWRHHAATDFLRRSNGNLKAVQALLGHSVIQSTARYAHVTEGDVRAILEAAPRNSPEGTPGSEKTNQQNRRLHV